MLEASGSSCSHPVSAHQHQIASSEMRRSTSGTVVRPGRAREAAADRARSALVPREVVQHGHFDGDERGQR